MSRLRTKRAPFASSTGNALMNPKSFDLTLWVGASKRAKPFPLRRNIYASRSMGIGGDMHVNLLADFIGNFTFLGRIKAT